MSPRYFRLFFLVLVVTIGLGLQLLPALALANEKPNMASDVAKNKTPPSDEQKASLIQVYSWATILPKELIDLQNSFSEAKSDTSAENELSSLIIETDQLGKEVALAKANTDLQMMQVTNFQNKVHKITNRLNKLSELITSSIATLSKQRKDWLVKKDAVAGFDKKEMLSLALAKEQQKDLIETVDKALELIEGQLKPVLVIGKKTGDLQVVLYSIDSDLQVLEKKLRATSIQKTSPSILSWDFYSRININLLQESYKNTEQFLAAQLVSLKNHMTLFLLSLCAFLLICFGIYKSQELISSSSRWYPFAVYPLATTVFISSSFNAVMEMMPVNFELPPQWTGLLHILTLLAAVRLSKNIIGNKLRRGLLKRMAIFMAIAMSIVALDLPQVLMLLYVFYVSLVALFYYFYQLRGIRDETGIKAWLKKVMGIIPAAVLIAGISGYDQFAVVLFSTLLSAVISCLIVWILYLLHFGFLDFLLSVWPSNSTKENREVILKSVQPIIAWIHILFLAGVQSVVWDLYPTVNEAMVGIFGIGFSFASIHISPGFFLTVIFVIYAAMLASKATQALLLKKVFPRYGAEKGVQLSISRLVHYAILTLGFLIMLNVLGFQLNQLTLIGGALGVGIGFGLQAIVNNFASGLILLFERPIKVGDTIQVGTEIGEVKNLGLRATIIQTFDNAEIVIPNSDLVTGQVTNWTLGERKVRVRVPVGVAYGTDVDKVLEILLSCAKANPIVLSTPKPAAFFLAFGASSLDFELRVWISEVLDRIQVLSDLNQDIESEFTLNNIEIPFPQTDLHLRSVDEAAACRIRGFTTISQSDKVKGEDGSSQSKT